MRCHRCAKHPDMLTQDRCPRCEVERLTKLNEMIARASGIHGTKITVTVSYRWRDVLSKFIHLLAVPGGEWNDPNIGLGNGSSSEGSRVTLPKELAEKIAGIVQEMDEEYVKALLRGYDDGLQIVSSAMSEVFGRLTNHQVKLKASKLKKLFAKDQYHQGELNIARDALEKELLTIFDRGN